MHGDDENRGFKGLGKLAGNQPPPVPPTPKETPPPEQPPPGGGRPHTGQISPPPGPGGSQPWQPPQKSGGSGCGKVALVLVIVVVLLLGGLMALGWYFGKDVADDYRVEERGSGPTIDPIDTSGIAASVRDAMAQSQQETEHQRQCRESAGVPPTSGEVLLRDLEAGGHTLRINGGPTDGLIKLKRDDTTVLSFYVGAYQTVAIEDIPDGTFRLLFASGSEFSRGCGEFVTDMSVSADPDPVEFAPIVEDGAEYYAIAEYTLTRQSGGNFEPESVDPDAFRD